MLILFAGLSALSLLTGSFSASSNDWVTILFYEGDAI